MTSEKTDPNILDIKLFLKVSIGIAVVIGGLLYTGYFLTNGREERVYKKYADETNAWINRNKDGLDKIFNEYFPKNGQCYEPQYYQGVQNIPTIPQCPNPSLIASATTQDIKDWSPIKFAKLINGEAYIMGLGGDTRVLSVSYPDETEKRSEFIKLLSGEKEEIRWADYTYDLQGKEVIIPIKDDSGKILGAVIRGVIEPSNIRR